MARAHPAPDVTATQPPSAQPGPRQHRLLQLLRQAGRELSAQELHQRLATAQEQQGLATVYRGLKRLQRQGQVRCRRLANGESVYAPMERDQHHLTCVQCGSSAPLPLCPLAGRELGLTQVLLNGFRPLFHTFEIHGLCVRCQQLQAAGHG